MLPVERSLSMYLGALLALGAASCGAEFKADTSGALGDGSGGSASGGTSGNGGGTGNGGTSNGGASGNGGTSNGGASGKGGASGDGGASGGGGTSDGGASGDGGTSGSGGVVTSDGGTTSSGGASGAGGSVVGTGGASGTGGSVVGVGGATAAGGAVGSTGGSQGAGGFVGTGGAIGAGGSPMQCAPGTVLCDKLPPLRCTDGGVWQTTTCGPLAIADVTAMSASGMPGFNAPGFRCKAISVCGLSQNCVYTGSTLGSLQSAEDTFYDGHSLAFAEAVKVSLAGGAASQCGDPSIDMDGGETLVVKTAAGRSVTIYFPKFSGTSFTLYVREDGATFYDAALTVLAEPAG
ncbi:MAG TPA: hypothetical protein VHE30_03395 [Polyangiaceae bacterium]|nr:hypothetical protein [Polyangiaceae bacterium]